MGNGIFSRLLGNNNNASQYSQQAQSSPFARCETGNCGDGATFARNIASSVPARDLRQTTATLAGSPNTVAPNITSTYGVAPTQGATTVTSGITQAAAAATAQNTNGVVVLENGVRAQIVNGQIKATIDLSAAQAGGKVDYSYRGNEASGYRQLRSSDQLSTLVKSEVAGIEVEKGVRQNNSSFLNVYAAGDLDTVTLTLTDANGGTRKVQLSRADILQKAEEANKAAAASKTETKPESPKASPTPEPTKPEVSATPAPTPSNPLKAESPEANATPPSPSTEPAPDSNTTETADTPASAEQKNETKATTDITTDAQTLADSLESETGFNLYNYPTSKVWETALNTVLSKYPSVQERAQLVAQATPEILGELIHESSAFSGVVDKLMEPLGAVNTSKLKSAVELLASEHSKVVDAYDTGKISTGLRTIDQLEKDLPGAETLGKVYWHKLANDAAYYGATSYDTVKDKLQAAVKLQQDVPQPQPATPQVSPVSEPSTQEVNHALASDAHYLLSGLQANTGIFSNSPANANFMGVVNATLQKYPTAANRAQLVGQIGAEKLGELIHEVKDFAPAVDALLSPLNEDAAKLKQAIEQLQSEYSKRWYSYDSAKIEQSLTAIKDIESKHPGAEKLGQVYWYKLGNDSAWVSPSSYEDMKQKLEASVKLPGSQSPQPPPAEAPKAAAARSESLNHSEVSRFIDPDGAKGGSIL